MNDLVKEFVDLSFEKYGSYSYSCGYLQSTVSALLEGYESKESVVRGLTEKVELMKKEVV
jgi:hypothetical protein